MPQTVSHYRLEEEIGRGGMGVVYRAVDTRLGRALAIKMLPADATADPDRNARFVREAQAASALNHPHIVTIYDIDATDGVTFIAMELVDGMPLDRLLARGPLAVPQALTYAAQIAAALGAAHATGIVHRDIKPGNIMITRDGRVKVLDFGLAKLADRAPEEVTAFATRSGLILGTAAYMSPEQADGRPVDGRSDVFSLGAVLYEMLAGRRPFAGSSDVGILTAILRDEPAPLRSARRDVPPAVAGIVERCLAKHPAARYPDAAALGEALQKALPQLTRARERGWRRPAVAAPLALLLIIVAAAGAWQFVQAGRARWVRDEVLPAITDVQPGESAVHAVRLARQAEPFAPEQIARVRQRWPPLIIDTQPHADLEIRDYADTTGPWEPMGRTPIRGVRLPHAYYRLRISRPGFVPLEIGSPGIHPAPLALTPAASAVPGMVPVAGGRYGMGVAEPVQLPDFWMGRHEVTNREFKRFLDAGGYKQAKYWTEPFREGGRVLAFDEAVARFRDATGRSGPATWELGGYPQGQDDFPVGGISWYESAAYARFEGLSLPTLYHWYRAAGGNAPDELFADILGLSNFAGKGPVAVGSLQGLGPWGTTDMAGNVKEWCANLARGTTRRYILGGGWNEPSYRFSEADAQDPWQRAPTFGARLVKNLGAVDEAAGPVGRVHGDPASLVPVSDALFEIYRRFYDYDHTPLHARTDAVDESAPQWRMETVSFDAAYGGERVPAYLFLPRTARPPYQTIVLFPSAFATVVASSKELDLRMFDFIIRSGRALLYPVYQGTFERRKGGTTGPSAKRDIAVQRAKDFFRAVDYLQTRKDVDGGRLGYYSLSMGAYFGPIPVSLEPRIKAAVFVSGGLTFDNPPETQPANFAPRVRVPVLLVNGRDDFGVPLDTQRRFIELIGTAPEHKRHVALEGGHIPSDFRSLIKEVLDWLDRYLGSVR